MSISLKTVSEGVKQYRLSICEGCEELRPTVKTCKQCGCYMPAKSTFAAARCPLNKWPTAEPGNSVINKIEDAILGTWKQ